MEVIVTIIFVAFIALAIYRYYQSYQKGKNWKERNLTKKRERAWEDKATIFTTDIDSVQKIYQKIDQSILAEAKIEVLDATDTSYDFIMRRESNLTGNATTALDWRVELKTLPQENGKYCYQFSYKHLATTNGGYLSSNQLNILLTQIEKAVLSLDPDTDVQRQKMKQKTSSGTYRLK